MAHSARVQLTKNCNVLCRLGSKRFNVKSNRVHNIYFNSLLIHNKKINHNETSRSPQSRLPAGQHKHRAISSYHSIFVVRARAFNIKDVATPPSRARGQVSRRAAPKNSGAPHYEWFARRACCTHTRSSNWHNFRNSRARRQKSFSGAVAIADI